MARTFSLQCCLSRSQHTGYGLVLPVSPEVHWDAAPSPRCMHGRTGWGKARFRDSAKQVVGGGVLPAGRSLAFGDQQKGRSAALKN